MNTSYKFVPQGVADTYYDEYEKKEDVITCIENGFKSYGFRQVLTPTFEYFDLYSGIEGTIHSDEMFKFIDGNGKILVLRPDVTTPIARMVASKYKTCSGYLKFSYVTSIFRMNDERNRPRKEFMQAGVEYLGNEKPDSDAEVIALAIKTIQDIKLKDFHIEIGQAEFFMGLMGELRISKEVQEKIRILVENKNLSELESVIDTLNISVDLKKNVLEIPFLYGKPEAVLKRVKPYILNNRMKKAIENLDAIYNILKDYGLEDFISFDLGLINHINYYTGVIFKGYIKNYGKVLLSGGRYDHLTRQYGYSTPATGFGINIDELLEAINMFDVGKEDKCYTDYLIIYNGASRASAFELASKLRKRGFIVESDASEDDLKRHIKNANYRNVKEIIEIEGKYLKIINLRKDTIYRSTFLRFLKSLEAREIVASIH